MKHLLTSQALRRVLATLLIMILYSNLSAQENGAAKINISVAPLEESAQSSLQPGLLPLYFYKYFERDVRWLPAPGYDRQKGKDGKPILQLNHQFGDGEVFDSGTNRGVGIRMRGFINFSQPGEYTLQALSNDGIELFLGDQLILSDPKQHSDQFSPRPVVIIEREGWYPVRLDYFQRKGTAALKLFWQPPESTELVPVPAEKYAHLPE